MFGRQWTWDWSLGFLKPCRLIIFLVFPASRLYSPDLE